MVTEPSPHARRRSRGCGSVLAYGYMFVVFSGVVGLIVGLVLTASTGLSSDVQRVIGAMLLIVSVLVGVLALVFFRLWLGARRAARSPKRELLVFRSAQGRMFQLSGTVVTAPGHLAPLSQRPCVLWHLVLLELHKDSDTPKDDRWVTVWSTSRLADIAIRYEQTRTLEVRPDARNDEPTLTVAPGGTLTIPSGAIRLRHFPWRPFPPTTANLLILDHEGLPAELHEQSVAFPGFYLASELCLITGDYVAGSQQSTTASEQWIPDPTVPFELTNLTQEQAKATSLGLFAAAGIVGMLFLQFFGFLLLHR